MEIKEINESTVVVNPKDFMLEHIFECGQCFRFEKDESGDFFGVAGERAIRISKSEDNIIFHNITIKEFNDFWLDYFDFNTDYSKIKSFLYGDECINNAINEGYGIRILHQDIFETIISFVISQSNNIPRIKKIIERLCMICGKKINYMNKTFYSFPTPEAILNKDISEIKAGFREKYIIDISKYIAGNTDFLDDLKSANSKQAKEMLMSFKGIGNKVSDCILLFGLGKTDSFPVDVWMHRIMEQLYFKKKCTKAEISDYASSNFGNYSGYAQQYLFYYALNHKSDFKEDIS